MMSSKRFSQSATCSAVRSDLPPFPPGDPGTSHGASAEGRSAGGSALHLHDPFEGPAEIPHGILEAIVSRPAAARPSPRRMDRGVILKGEPSPLVEGQIRSR